MMVYIIALNWNGGADTVSCLESVFRLEGADVRVVVCDNASTDGSIALLRAWARGDLLDGTHVAAGPRATAPVRKPLRLVEYDREQAERSGAGADRADMYLVHTGANLGFAGGCNVGVRFVMADPRCAFVWLLNNDTVVEPGALRALVARAQEPDRPGMVGSMLCYDAAPMLVQALGGGTWSRWRAMSAHIGEGEPRRVLTLPERTEVERRMAYVVGASMLVPRAFIEQVGLMQEDYFLYFEEMDWAERGRRCAPPWNLGFAADSVIYHKVGASAGTGRRSMLSLHYLTRSRLRFVKRFYRPWLGMARVAVAWEGVKYLLKGRVSEAGLMLREALRPVRVGPASPAARTTHR